MVLFFCRSFVRSLRSGKLRREPGSRSVGFASGGIEFVPYFENSGVERERERHVCSDGGGVCILSIFGWCVASLS